MRSLRILTTLFVVLTVGLILSFPSTVGAPPDKVAVRSVKKNYAIRLAVFMIALPLSFFGAATCSLLLFRKMRIELAEQQLQNLADLLTSIPEAKQTDDARSE